MVMLKDTTMKIRFKGRRMDRKSWVFGFFYKDKSGNCKIITDDGSRYKVEEDTVCQLAIKTPVDLDKFGKSGNYEEFLEIYTGDVVEVRYRFNYIDGYKGYKAEIGDRFVVEKLDSGFTLVPVDIYENWSKSRIPNTCGLIDNYQLWNYHRFIKPVGNIYDKD